MTVMNCLTASNLRSTSTRDFDVAPALEPASSTKQIDEAMCNRSKLDLVPVMARSSLTLSEVGARARSKEDQRDQVPDTRHPANRSLDCTPGWTGYVNGSEILSAPWV